MLLISQEINGFDELLDLFCNLLQENSSPDSQENHPQRQQSKEGNCKKGVTFSPEEPEEIEDQSSSSSSSTPPPPLPPPNNAKTSKMFNGSDRDLREGSPLSDGSSDGSSWGDYDKVIVSHNLAEEILDEIYGTRTEKGASSEDTPPPPSSPSEDEEDEDEARRKKSLADEILEELYGKNESRLQQGDIVDGLGLSRDDSDSELLWRERISGKFFPDLFQLCSRGGGVPKLELFEAAYMHSWVAKVSLGTRSVTLLEKAKVSQNVSVLVADAGQIIY